MKKGLLILNLIIVSILFSACMPTIYSGTKVRQTIAISTMDTFIGGYLYVEDSLWNEVFDEMKSIYHTYHVLTDNYMPQDEGIKGIYYINQQAELSDVSATVEIDKLLYDLLTLGVTVTNETNGYFNMTMGKVIDVWKNMIKEYQTGDEVSLEAVNQTNTLAQSIQIIDDPIKLETISGKYYVTLKKGAKLDLGAIAKGYATQKVVEYLESMDIKEFLINGGSSSVVFGEENRRNPEGSFTIGLKDPIDVISHMDVFGHEARLYATFTDINHNVTTSGSYEQFVKYEDTWYHHIISPITKKPENYYMSISLLGLDAGRMDAYSTALFNMPKNELEAFLVNKDIEVVSFDFDGLITNYNKTSRFKELS